MSYSSIRNQTTESPIEAAPSPAFLPPPAETAAAADAHLARALREGDTHAASLAWRQFRPVVYRTLERMLGTSEDLADLTQDVFFRFFNKVLELRSLESLRSFVIGIAFRRAREEIRRRHVRRSLRPMVEDHYRQHQEHEWSPEDRHALARGWEFLERMGMDGQVYTLRALEGRELGDIANTLGVSISTVRRSLSRAEKKVARLHRQEWTQARAEAAADRYFAPDAALAVS